MARIRYTYDLRLNTTIEVIAGSEETARKCARKIMDRLVLTDRLTNKAMELDLEDGLELIDVEKD